MSGKSVEGYSMLGEDYCKRMEALFNSPHTRYNAEVTALVASERFGTDCCNSLYRHYYEDSYNDAASAIRLSSLGKPIVYIACALPPIKQELQELGYWQDLPLFEERVQWLLMTGDIFEAWVVTVLQKAGEYEVIPPPDGEIQHEIEWEGVKGHLDIMLRDCVAEVKTMNSWYFNSFTNAIKYGDVDIMDQRGYLTQLASYMDATGKPGVWILLNKDTGAIRVVEPNQEDVEAVLKRGKRILPKLRSLEKDGNIEKLLELFVAPPPKPEVYRKKETGKFMVPTGLKYWPLKEVFYELRQGKNQYGKPTEYVVGRRLPEEIYEQAPNKQKRK